MNKVLIIVLLFSANCFADVAIHQDEYSLDSVQAESESFYGRMYRWSAWEKSEVSKSFDVSPSPIKQAYESGEQDKERVDLEENELLKVFPGGEGEALADYYYDTDPLEKEMFCFIGEDCYRPYREIVFNTKVAIKLPDAFSFESLKLEEMVKKASAADQPHLYSKVTKSVAKGFINPVHLGQNQISEHPNDEIYMSLLNFGGDYYQCTRLNKALNINSKGIIEGLFYPYRIYNINLFKELSLDGISKRSVIEGNPVKVFEQKIVASTDLIKSATTYIAFYKMSDGSKKVVVYAAVVSTSKVGSLMDMYVNGLDGEASSSILFNNENQAVLNSRNLDLGPVSGNCSKGLGPGVGRYVYGLAKSIVNQ